VSRRGDLVIVSAPGDYGKPRPAVVVQSDRLPLDSVLVALITTAIVEAPLYRRRSRPLKPTVSLSLRRSWSTRSSRCPEASAARRSAGSTMRRSSSSIGCCRRSSVLLIKGPRQDVLRLSDVLQRLSLRYTALHRS
jgi:hypothetical protein